MVIDWLHTLPRRREMDKQVKKGMNDNAKCSRQGWDGVGGWVNAGRVFITHKFSRPEESNRAINSQFEEGQKLTRNGNSVRDYLR